MFKLKKVFFQIENNIDEVIKEKSSLGKDLFKLLIKQHAADIALFFNRRIKNSKALQLFNKLPKELQFKVFEDLSESRRISILKHLSSQDTAFILKNISGDSFAELFEFLPDQDLKKYLKLLQKKQRNNIISRLSFNPDSAGRIMHSNVLSLEKDLTVKKAISILQRSGQKKELLQTIYVTDPDDKLVGNINLGDLVLNKPDVLLKNILHKNVLVLNVDTDQEEVAQLIHHYSLMSAPVVDKDNHFLGVITAEDVVDVLEEEASEDVYKMSGLSSVEHDYMQTPIWKLIWQRSPWLVGLLLLQSLSSFILSGFQNIVDRYFIIPMFLTMLIGTGGNAGNQSSAIVIRGLATGQISRKNSLKVLLKEFGTSIAIALLLTIVSFFRVFLFQHDIISAFTVSIALFLIVITSMFLGALLPLLLERLNLDPAHSAAPFLATLMDILGVLIYCLIVSKVLG
ncbi:magnesium transporter [Candidatus Dependentiae bacterium]|nr:magnesium transporter [Candidatus Dependentiae bacterium]